VTLVIPPGALPGDTAVTMTPLAKVKRVPFKRGVAGAVQLGPEGLVLAKPAKLLIHTRKRLSRKARTAFSATGSGASFHIYPSKGGQVMSVPLMHFSIYGESEASKTELGRESDRRQSGPLAEIERDLASNGSDKELAAAFESMAKRIAPDMQAALSDDAMVSRALDEGLALAEALRLAGWSTEVLPEIGNRIPAAAAKRLRPLIDKISAAFPAQILENALARALNRCEAEHSRQSREHVLEILELQRLFGLSDEIDLSLLERCDAFELRYTHSSAGSASYHYDHSSMYAPNYGDYSESRNVAVSATVPLVRAADGTFSGAGPISWHNTSWSTDDDTTSGNQAGTTCEIDFKGSLVSAASGELTVSSISLKPQEPTSITFAGLGESWHEVETLKAGYCGTFDQDLEESNMISEIAQVHTAWKDSVKWAPGHESFALSFDGGWSPGSGNVVASRVLGGITFDIGPDRADRIPYTDVLEVVRLTG
jgi:hypothetical protein